MEGKSFFGRDSLRLLDECTRLSLKSSKIFFDRFFTLAQASVIAQALDTFFSSDPFTTRSHVF